jgi:CAAX prenyl protease-like protein
MPDSSSLPSDHALGSNHAGPGDDVAYLLPMGTFLVLTWVGTEWDSLYPWTYLLKTVLTAILLIAFRRHYTKIRWNYAWLGALVGLLVLFQWVGMEKLLLHFWPHYPRLPHDIYVPAEHIASPWLRGSFIAVRWTGASLVVPVMEELFWRDYLWRTLLAPNDFKLAQVGEWDWKVYLIVAVAFGAGVHVEWMTAIVCGLIFGALLVRTRSLGACIIAHGVTNFLLGAYVLGWHDWAFW